MGGAVERLTNLVRSADRFAIPYSELRQAQAEAMNERFEERVDRIKLLAFRAKEAGTTEIRGREDMVPLLFPHTAYKSYPESFLSEQKWDRLGKWLGTVSPYPIGAIETSEVKDIDDWIERLEREGPLRLVLERHDRQVGHADRGRPGHGVVTRRHRRRLLLGLRGGTREGSPDVRGGADRRCPQERHHSRRAAGGVRRSPFRPVPVAGSADHRWPTDQHGGAAQGDRRRHRAARARSHSSRRLRRRERRRSRRHTSFRRSPSSRRGPTSCSSLACGTHSTTSPRWSGRWATARRTSTRTTASMSAVASNEPSSRPTTRSSSTRRSTSRPTGTFQNYSMQELNSGMPRCQKGGRYHVPPWMVPFVLNEDGDELLPHGDGRDRGPSSLLRPRARRAMGGSDHRRQDLPRRRSVPLRERRAQHPRRHHALRRSRRR